MDVYLGDSFSMFSFIQWNSFGDIVSCTMKAIPSETRWNLVEQAGCMVFSYLQGIRGQSRRGITGTTFNISIEGWTEDAPLS